MCGLGLFLASSVHAASWTAPLFVPNVEHCYKQPAVHEVSETADSLDDDRHNLGICVMPVWSLGSQSFPSVSFVFSAKQHYFAVNGLLSPIEALMLWADESKLRLQFGYASNPCSDRDR